MQYKPYRILLVGVWTVLAACSDSVGPEPEPTISLSPATRSIEVGESYQASATVDDPSGKLDSTAVVWESLDTAIASVTATGVVSGRKPGKARIVGSVSSASDTIQVEVLQTPASIEIKEVPTLGQGDTVRLEATVIDTEGDEISPPIGWKAMPSSVVRVDSAGLLIAVGVGRAVVTASAGKVSATIAVEVRAASKPVECESGGISMSVGEVRNFEGAGILTLCLSGGAQYVLQAVNADSLGATAAISGERLATPSVSGQEQVFGARTLSAAARQALPIDREFESRLRRKERERLSPVGARAGGLGLTRQRALPSLEVGDLLDLSTSTDCEAPSVRIGRVEFVGERSIVVADTSNPGDFSREVYARFGVLYDTLLHPVVTSHFGEPAGMNGETRVVIFYTRAVNELTPEGSEGFVGGFFWAGDLFPRETCAGSNEREMFYMLAPDPEGTINGNARSIDFVEQVTAGTIAHELQHLINASRRIFVNEATVWEEPWLNEGLSHIAEEVVFYHASGLTPERNLDSSDLRASERTVDAANRYALANLLRLDVYLRDVEAEGPFQSDEDLATRGASWHFLRYALDRHGGDVQTLLSELVDSPTAGLENLANVFGVDPRDWFADNALSVFTDDHVIGVDSRYTHPSWNVRDVLNLLNPDGYQLQSRELGPDDAMTLQLAPWGSAFVRVEVPTGEVGNVQIGDEDSPLPSRLRLQLVRTR